MRDGWMDGGIHIQYTGNIIYLMRSHTTRRLQPDLTLASSSYEYCMCIILLPLSQLFRWNYFLAMKKEHQTSIRNK